MVDNDLVMDSKRLQKMRPDLYPRFLEILKSDAPYYHDLINNTPLIDELLEMFGGKMTVKVSDLPPRARDLIVNAMNEALERNKKNEKK